MYNTSVIELILSYIKGNSIHIQFNVIICDHELGFYSFKSSKMAEEAVVVGHVHPSPWDL